MAVRTLKRASALSETGATRVLVIADLRGNSRDAAATLEGARLTAIDVDNFERVFAELGPQLSLNFSSPALRGGSHASPSESAPAAAAGVGLEIRCA